MEYFGNIIAVTMQDLTGAKDGPAVMSIDAYKWAVRQGSFNVLRQGKGLGHYALIEYQSLPERFKIRFEEKYGNPEQIMKQHETQLSTDKEAQRFFSGLGEGTFRLPNGECLPDKYQKEYTLNASVLNALQDMVSTQKAMRRASNNSTPVIWASVFTMAEELRDTYGHTLPKSEARLRDKMRQYAKEGYSCLVSKKFGNSNTLKITKAAGRQIIALRRSRVPVYTTRQLFEEFNRIAERRGWKTLDSEKSLLGYLERPDIKPLWYDAVYGELAAKQLYARHHKTEMPSMRDSLWYGDGTKLNLFYKAYEGGRSVVRTMQVYEVVDAFSEMLLGYCISNTEQFDAQYAAFRMAVEISGHKPYEIVTDNQGGQRSKIAQKFFANICHVARPTAPYNAQSKTIESVFGRFQREVLGQDWRFTGQNISSKEGWKINREFIEANKDSLYTYEELLSAYADARNKWNSMPHFNTKVAHSEMYFSSTNPGTETLTDLDMIDLFWITTDRSSQFTADGITIQYRGKKYTYEVLDNGMPDMEWRSRNTGRDFFVRFDPQNMSRVLLYSQTPMGLRYETAAYPYLCVHRNIQEQREGDMALIKQVEQWNKEARIRRQIEGHNIELEHGVAPEQHGLRTPAIKGISEAEYERMADEVVIIPATQSEPIAVGEYTKAVSNIDYDPLAAINRL